MLQILCQQRIIRENAALKDRPVLLPIQQADPSGYDADAQAYFAHYNLDMEGLTLEHRFGSFESGGFTLAAHLYKPAQYTATVVLLHGYLNHSGQFKNLIRHLLGNNFAVAVYDLPGHGLSSGKTAEINSFDQYVQTTLDFLSIGRQFLDGPYHVLGFSTGAAILIEMLIDDKADDFNKILLAGPLIQWSAYEQSKATYRVYKEFTDKIARFHRRNSSDKDYLRFNKTQDYLHAHHLSLRWVKALFDWNEKVEAADVCDRKMMVIQGDKDGTVDWQYNLKLIAKKFPNAKTQMIPGANHELFNEAPEYKQQALDSVTNYFRQD